MILLTGITGNNGGATAQALLDQGVKFRALVRDLDKAAKWGEQGVELDERQLKRLLTGVDLRTGRRRRRYGRVG